MIHKIIFFSAIIGVFLLLYSIKSPSPSHITILIHGTKLSEIMPSFMAAPLRKLEANFFNNQERGLIKINHDATKKYNYFHHDFGPLLATADPANYPLQDMYVFGHAGTMDPEKRALIGSNLYYLIKKLSHDYTEKDGAKPIITIIGHSHGGNIALNMVKGLKDDIDQLPFTVDKLILLGVPVQKFTQYCVESPLFKKIYHLHSHLDLIQIADLQGLYHYDKEKEDNALFSKRHFALQPNLTQAQMLWKKAILPTVITNKVAAQFFTLITKTANLFNGEKRGLLHVEFLLPPFVSRLPTILKELDRQTLIQTTTAEKPDIVLEIE